MKVYAQIVVSRDGYIAWVGDDISWISEKTREQYNRTIRGMGNCIVGRRAYQVLERNKLFDRSDNPFTVILSKHNYPSQLHRHFTHAKPKNILKLLDEKWYSSTVICGGAEAIQLFMDAGLIERLIVYREDVDVGEGVKWEKNIVEHFVLSRRAIMGDFSLEELYSNKKDLTF